MIIDHFLGWLATADLDERPKAVSALARAYLVSEMQDRDRDALEATLTVLLDDPRPEVRRTIAEVMAPSDRAPRHLILALCEGASEEAAIVAAQSPILLEAELIDLIAGGESCIQIAIAGRRWLSPSLSAAIAEIGTVEAALALVRNVTASIPVFSLHKLAERFGSDGPLREAMLAMPHLPLTVRHALLSQLSQSLSGFVVGMNWLKESRASTMMGDVADKVTVQLAIEAADEELAGYVAYLRDGQHLTTTLLLRAVTLGDIRFLEETLTQLTALPRGRVGGVLAEGRESACLALFQKAGLPERTFPAFYSALIVQRELAIEVGARTHTADAAMRFPQRVIERVLSRYSGRDQHQCDDLIVLLRRFAADAARDAARQFVGRALARPPMALPPPLPTPEPEMQAAPPVVMPFDLEPEADVPEVHVPADLMLARAA